MKGKKSQSPKVQKDPNKSRKSKPLNSGEVNFENVFNEMKQDLIIGVMNIAEKKFNEYQNKIMNIIKVPNGVVDTNSAKKLKSKKQKKYPKTSKNGKEKPNEVPKVNNELEKEQEKERDNNTPSFMKVIKRGKSIKGKETKNKKKAMKKDSVGNEGEKTDASSINDISRNYSTVPKLNNKKEGGKTAVREFIGKKRKRNSDKKEKESENGTFFGGLNPVLNGDAMNGANMDKKNNKKRKQKSKKKVQ